METLHIRTAPHLLRLQNTPAIMRTVCFSLLPLCLLSTYFFGLSALLLFSTTLIFALLTERLFCLWQKKPSTLNDYSAALTGLLFALTLPPGLPLWMAALGSIISIAMGKFVFGGLGQNPFNPALVGRAFLMAAFPGALTRWQEPVNDFLALSSSTLTLPFLRPQYDGLSAATALASQKFGGKITDPWILFIGKEPGSLGETSFVLIALCGGYLVFKGVASWRIPLSIIVSVGVCAFIFHGIAPDRFAPPVFHLFSGGLALGAFFLATDPATSPLTGRGMFLFGAFIGVCTFSIRSFGGLPEGVMYAILLGNAVTPLINQVTGNRVYGS